MRAASVFARPLNNVDPEDEGGGGGFIAPGGNEHWDGERLDEVSELRDCDLEVMGTVKLLIFVSDDFVSDSTLDSDLGSSSTGISSGAGMGRPLAAATSWFSVHESEWSFNPLQNGAILRSI